MIHLEQFNEEVKKGILGILVGIDATEVEKENGWWETSTGAEFGCRKRQELRNFITQKLAAHKELILKMVREKMLSMESFDEVVNFLNDPKFLNNLDTL